MWWVLLFAFIPSLLFSQNSIPALSTSPELATVETTADGSEHGGKFDGVHDILTASGSQDAVLLRFRTALIERWSVEKAVVVLHIPNGEATPDFVKVAVVSAPWTESSSVAPPRATGIPVPTRKLQQGWFSIELPPEMSRQLAVGTAASLAFSAKDGARLAVHSRRTGQFMPYLLVRGHAPPSRNP